MKEKKEIKEISLQKVKELAKSMSLIEVANELGISPQQLRYMLKTLDHKIEFYKNKKFIWID